jgi:hypothetical protein
MIAAISTRTRLVIVRRFMILTSWYRCPEREV